MKQKVTVTDLTGRKPKTEVLELEIPQQTADLLDALRKSCQLGGLGMKDPGVLAALKEVQKRL